MILTKEHSVKESAGIIFEHFIIGQSCTITGYIEREDGFWSKGELVIEELKRLDLLNNCNQDTKGKFRRKRKILPDTIGGYVAQKIFKFKITELTKYTIWRIQ